MQAVKAPEREDKAEEPLANQVDKLERGELKRVAQARVPKQPRARVTEHISGLLAWKKLFLLSAR